MFGLFLYFSKSERNIQNQQTLHYKKLHLLNHQTGWRLIFRQLMNQIRVSFMSEARPGSWMPQQPPELRRLLWISVWVSLAVTFTHVVSSQKVCLTWTLITEKWLWKQTETCVLYTSVMLWSYLWRILKQTVQKWCSGWRLWDIRSGLSAAQCCKHQVITGDSSASAAAWKKNVMMMKKTVQ